MKDGRTNEEATAQPLARFDERWSYKLRLAQQDLV